MKKIILLSVFSLSLILTFAQPALTWVRPPFGTTKSYNMYKGTMAEPSVGANQVWDYSALTPDNIGVGVYTDPATLPAASLSSFQTTTYAEVWTVPAAPSLDKAIIDFYYDCPDSLINLGQQSSGGGAQKKGYLVGLWKITFGDSAKASYKSSYTGKLVPGYIKYAAYGTLKTKFGSYDNVAMLTYPGTKLFFQTTPYFGILMEIVYSNSTTIWGAHIYSYGTASGVTDLSSANEVSIYSTFKSNEIVINIADYIGNCNIKVIDLQGKTVYQNIIQFNADRQILSLDNVNSGIYLVELNFNNKIHTSKVLLSK